MWIKYGKKINQRACYNSIWSWSPMPCEKHGARASVTTKISAFGLGFCLLSPSGHVFHTAWETMIKSYITDCSYDIITHIWFDEGDMRTCLRTLAAGWIPIIDDLFHVLDACSKPWATALIARFMGPTWGPSGAETTQVGPMLVPWSLLSGSAIWFWATPPPGPDSTAMHTWIRFTCINIIISWYIPKYNVAS